MKNTMEWVKVTEAKVSNLKGKEVLAIDRNGYALVGSLHVSEDFDWFNCYSEESELIGVTHYAIITNPNK